MKADTAEPIKPIQRNGITVRIRETEKNGFVRFVVDYRVLGKRKLVWRSSLADARVAANDAIDKITAGQGEVLNLTASDANNYVRARDAMEGLDKPMDEVVREYREARSLLNGRATVIEACRDWARRHAVELPRIMVDEAVRKFVLQCIADGKSKLRLRGIRAVLNRFSESFRVEVHTLEPKMIADYLTALPFSDCTKYNHRSQIGFFNRWLILRGFLAKATDWLEGIQKYTNRMDGEISIYSADEMRRLIAAADERILPHIVIGAFAGLRHAEIARLDWSEIDLKDGYIEIKAAKAKTKTRRIVPLKDNLKAFLMPLAKPSGKIITLANSSNALIETAEATGDAEAGLAPLTWKHNALRHSFISYRVAECGDVPRVADEAGNSPQIIRTNYLKRVRPAAAAEWFSIQPKAAR
jgi:integrase